MMRDIASLLRTSEALVVIRRLSLGSLIVDYTVMSDSDIVSTSVRSAANETLSVAVFQRDWLTETQALYSDVSGTTEGLQVETSSVDTSDAATGSSAKPTESSCNGPACYAFIGVGIAAVAVVVTGAAFGIRRYLRSRRAAATEPVAAAPPPTFQPYPDFGASREE